MARVTFRLYDDGSYRRFDENGDEIEDDAPVIRDRHAVRVPLTLMDTAAQRDPREIAWSAMCDRLSNAWKQRGDPLPLMTDAATEKGTPGVPLTNGYRAPSATAPAPDARVAAAKARIARLASAHRSA